MNNKVTSPKIASLAAKVLHDPSASATAKQLAGSALSQVNKQNQSSPKLDHIASNVLKSEKYSEATKELAGSVLAQSRK